MTVMGIFRRHAPGTPGSAVVPPPRSNALSVTPDKALTLATVYRAVATIQGAVQQLPMVVHRGEDLVESRLAERPDVHRTTSEFWGQTVLSLALHGEAFWYKTRGTDGTVMNLSVVDPSRVMIMVDDPHAIVPRLTYWIGERKVTHLVSHLRLSTKPGEYRGFGPIQAAWPDLREAILLRDYSAAYYDIGQPLGVLSTDQVINQETANAYRETWAATMNDRTIAVLGQGMQYHPLYGDANQTQLVESTRQAITMVARLFGIPPLILASGIDGNSMTYATSEGMMLAWLQTGLAPYLNAIEGAFSDCIPRGQTARFKLDALLRPDTGTRVAAYQTLITAGVMSPEEARRSEGIPGPAPQVEQPNNANAGQEAADGSPV